MKKDWFEPHVRMTHRFGESRGSDNILGAGNFAFNPPQNLTTLHTPGFGRKEKGEYHCIDPMSPVIKPSGRSASYNGPAPDYAKEVAMQMPASTKMRKSIK